jgi:hypothetical protein
VVYVVWICFGIVTTYFFFVDTNGKALEKMGEIFDAPNPRKASTEKIKVEINERGRVPNDDDA